MGKRVDNVPLHNTVSTFSLSTTASVESVLRNNNSHGIWWRSTCKQDRKREVTFKLSLILQLKVRKIFVLPLVDYHNKHESHLFHIYCVLGFWDT